MNRVKATGIHILISIVIVLSVLTTMYLLWYPNAYFALMGGQKLITVLASVDIFLGPLLTFAVFKSGKKGLKFDLVCIGVLQIVALSYGVYVMFQARPVFTVFNKNKFQISGVVEITPEELAKAKNPNWRSLSISGPILVAIGVPDKKDKKESMFARIETDSAYRYPRLYDHYENHRNEVINSGKPLATLSNFSLNNKVIIEKFLSRINRPQSDFLFVPISSELEEMSVVVDVKTGNFIEIIDAHQ